MKNDTGREFHVALSGRADAAGTAGDPLRSVTAAAQLAQPGDTVTVHAGTYRERVDPPRGGTSDACRIVYQAAAGEQVFIKGSEVVTGWEQVAGPGYVWKVVLPNEMFGADHPYDQPLRGHWFSTKGVPITAERSISTVTGWARQPAWKN